jgi:oligoribonuclease
MTGLDPRKDSILEIFCVLTDSQLNILDSNGWHAVIQHSQCSLDAMDDWCTRTHSSTGLFSAVLESKTSAEDAAEDLLAYLKNFLPPRQALLAGNSVHADKSFLAKEPYDKVLRYLHYRIFDVSSLKEAARRWAPEEKLDKIPLKKNVHEARADILESIEEARAYCNLFFS